MIDEFLIENIVSEKFGEVCLLGDVYFNKVIILELLVIIFDE